MIHEWRGNLVEIGNKTAGDMNQHERERQARYRAKRMAQGDHRLELWIPHDLMAAIDDTGETASRRERYSLAGLRP